jgi:hypothetical protein
MIMTIALAMMNLVKNTFSMGYFKFTDETKVELLMAFKAFCLVFILLHYYGFNTFFDVDLEKAHD